jgi:hypothetical protein
MKKLIVTLVTCLVAGTTLAAGQGDNPYKKYTEKLPFQMAEVQAPVIPEYEVNVKDFGGVGDGIALNTDAFA